MIIIQSDDSDPNKIASSCCCRSLVYHERLRRRSRELSNPKAAVRSPDSALFLFFVSFWEQHTPQIKTFSRPRTHTRRDGASQFLRNETKLHSRAFKDTICIWTLNALVFTIHNLGVAFAFGAGINDKPRYIQH